MAHLRTQASPNASFSVVPRGWIILGLVGASWAALAGSALQIVGA
jgi:hypothetical protein